jgi:hypothetical protein
MGLYLALGDSISIDDYTGVRGGAPSQLARTLGVELVDLTRDGNTTDGVLADLVRVPAAADVVALTVGGNDLLGGDLQSTRSTTRATATTTWDGRELGEGRHYSCRCSWGAR